MGLAVWGVQARSIARVWPLIADAVARALRRARANQTPDELRERLEDRDCQLWLAWDGARPLGLCITEIHASARGKTCNVVAVSGSVFVSWRPMMESTIREWARSLGCTRMEVSGRPGWGRYLRKDGWRKIGVTLEVDI